MCNLLYRKISNSSDREGGTHMIVSFIEMYSAMIMLIVFSALAFYSLLLIIKITPIYLEYKKSEYCNESGVGAIKVIFDRGVRGEFLIFREIEEKWRGYNKTLTNLYLPKKDGTTTEIDLVMINQYGIYVIESKNYSGKIYGSDKYKEWTQYFPHKKYKFYNPVWQNSLHVNSLKNAINLEEREIVHSLVVFGDRCELKKVQTAKKGVRIFQRKELVSTLEQDREVSGKVYFTTNEIDDRYAELKKYSLQDNIVKENHIKNIQKNI